MTIQAHLRHLGSILSSLLLLGSVGVGAAHAATYYVATTGNDANPGTAAAPLRTLNKGVTKLHPGDTLYVKSGTYAEALINKIPGGTASSPVTVAASPGQTVTLKPTGTSAILSFAGADRRYITVDGFILDGTNLQASNAHGIVIAHPGTDLSQAAQRIRIKNTEVKNIPENGVDVRKGSTFNTFTNLRVHNTGLSGTGHGLYIHSHDNVVEHSRIYDNKKCGIQFYDKDQDVNNNIFRNNQVSNNGKGGSTDNPCKTGLWIGAGHNTQVYNNLIWDNQDRGVVVSNGSTNAKVYQNTIYGNGSYGLYVSATAALIKNNIVYGNNGGNGKELYKWSAQTILAQNLTTNPKFVAPASANFKVQVGSPAINAGVTLSEVTKDYVNVARPQGGAYDIGAYEYTGSTSSALVSAPLTLRIVTAP